MKRLYLAVTFILFASACTFTPQDESLKADFHPPIVYQPWKTEKYVLRNGEDACSISSGYNGLTVLLDLNSNDVLVKSNRDMTPGMTFTVIVNKRTFETSDVF